MIKIGIVGFGLAAKVYHLPILKHLDGCRVEAVFSSQEPEVIHQVLPGTKVYACLNDFLQQSELELILVLTPNDSHFAIAKQALLANKHVVVDKPLSATLAEAEELMALAGERGKLLSVYYNRRWDSDFLTVKQLIEGNKLGHISYFESRFDKYRPKIWGRWREQLRPGSGLIFDIGSHVIDQALYLFGVPNTVSAEVLTQRPKAKVTDYFNINLGYDSKQVILRGSCLAAKSPFRFYLEGANGTYLQSGHDIQEQQMAEWLSPYSDGWGVMPEQNTGTVHLLEQDPLPYKPVPGCYRMFYENVIKHLEGEAPLLVTAQQAVNVQKVIELAMGSSSEGKVMPFYE